MQNEKQTCPDCSQEFLFDDAFLPYYDPPYYYGRDGGGRCIACFLGVGPNDLKDEPLGKRES